jgi:RimJ/RimL family protein N-acetyltransferase
MSQGRRNAVSPGFVRGVVMAVAPARSKGFDDVCIVTARLMLRPPRAGDAAVLVEGLGDPGVSRMLSRVLHPYGFADAEDYVALAAAQNTAESSLHLVVVRDDGVVGGIGLHGLPAIADFGYWIGRAHWGNGYAPEAAAGLLGHAFRVLGAARVPSGVFIDNPASMRVQEKLGFERVGTSRRFSQARGHAVEHIDTLLVRARFEELHP